MKQTLPWNVNGIPPEARELARAAALRDGVSVGDWLTRRILEEGAASEPAPETRDSLSPRETADRDADPRRDREISNRLARSDAETDSAVRRLDDVVKLMARRLENTERSSHEAHRAMSSAASEINAAARDQAEAFASLTERINRVERQSDTAALREAVLKLHQGLSRLADQFARTASESAGQVANFSNSVEELAGKLTAARVESTKLGQLVDERLASVSDRVTQAEAGLASASRLEVLVTALQKRGKASEETLHEALGRQAATGTRLDENLAALETRVKSFEERQQDALAHQLGSATRLEENQAALEARMAHSERQAEDARAQQLASNTRLEENLCALESRLKAADEQMQSAQSQQLASGNRVEETLAALEGRLKSSEERLHEALAHHLALGNRVEETLAAFAERLKASEERVQDSLGHHVALGNRLEENFAELEARMNSSEERLQAVVGSAPSGRIGERFAELEAQIKASEEHVQQTVGSHLVGIGRNLDNIVTRLEHAERRGDAESNVQDGLRLFSQRIEAAEKKSRDAFAEIKTNIADTARRLDAIEASQRSGAPGQTHSQPQARSEPMPLGPPSEKSPRFDAPPFPSGNFSPLGPVHGLSPATVPNPAQSQATPPQSGPAVQDYLAQARRAARAASEQTANNGNGTAPAGGFVRSTSFDKDKRSRQGRILTAVAAVLGGVLILAVPFVMLRGWGQQNEVVALAPDAAPLNAGTNVGEPTASLTSATGSNAMQDSANPVPATASAPPETVATTARGRRPPAPPKAAPTTPVASPQALPPTANPVDRLADKARSGDVKAALVLGLKYADGDGIAPSDADAVLWLTKAAEAGEPVGQYRLGTLFEKGRGVTTDAKQAARWYSESAKNGNRKAMHNLAVAYADGSGIDKNFGEAARWFRNAAELGLTDSQFNLAVLYERGLGVPASLNEAYRWYAIAANQGDSEAKARIDALVTQLKPADKNAIDKSIKAFKARPASAAANDPPLLAQVVP
jgi:localization factor PodJL